MKALRYYDKENMLQPSFRSETNQYRYYNDQDLKKALLIKFLRSISFSIIEIKDVLDGVEQKEDLMYILQEKINIIEQNISKEKRLIETIQKGMHTFDVQSSMNQYPIDIKDVEASYVASIRFQGKYRDLDQYIPILYQAVKQHKNGKHFCCYYDMDYAEMADIELCIPIKKAIVNKTITCINLPKIRAIHTTHYGDYDSLYHAYQAVFTYANEHKFTILAPIRELYVKSPGMIFRGNPASYVTEIFLPFEIDRKDT